MAALPPKGFATAPLVLHEPSRSRAWLRLYSDAHADPLGFGRAPSRFSDPRIGEPGATPYGVVYLGRTLKVCFLEAIVRDRGAARLGLLPVEMAQLEHTICAEIAPKVALTLVDLRGDGAVRMGVPTDAVRAAVYQFRWAPGRPQIGRTPKRAAKVLCWTGAARAAPVPYHSAARA